MDYTLNIAVVGIAGVEESAAAAETVNSHNYSTL